MYVTKTDKLESVQNKGQRAVIVGVLAKLSAPISLDALTKKVTATGQYNGKGTKGHVNKWAQEKAGGDQGSVRYHLRELAREGRVKVADTEEAAGKVRGKRAKKAEPAPDAPQPDGEDAIEQMAEALDGQADHDEAEDLVA